MKPVFQHPVFGEFSNLLNRTALPFRRVSHVLLGSLTCLLLTLPANALESLQIKGVSSFYDAPYLLDFNFSLRDQDNHAVVVEDLTEIEVVCKENGIPISPSETGFRLLSGATKQLKCFLILDYTLSMADPVANGDDNENGYSDALETMELAAKTLIGTLNDDAQVGLYEFHREDEAHPPQKVSDLTSDKDLLGSRIDRIWADYVQFFPAATRCWDAVYAAVAEYSESNPGDEQRFVVFLSDGKDESSTRPPAELINLAKARGVKVYAIGFGQELEPSQMQNIANQTDGQYYSASNLEEMTEGFRQITDDLRGQYVLRWATLKRSSSAFQPSFQVTYQGRTVAHTGPSYRPTDYEGDVLQGRLLFDASLGESGDATVSLHALYVPRFITRIRLFYFAKAARNLIVENVPLGEGGICPDDWVVEVNEAGGWIEVRSPTPENIFTGLPYATLGKVLRFHLSDVATLEDCFFELEADNSFYSESGQSFALMNPELVTPPAGTPPPHGTPILWLTEHGYPSRFAWAELRDPDGDFAPMWAEQIAGTDPGDPLSVFTLVGPEVDGDGRHLMLHGMKRRIYQVEYSDDCRTWQALLENVEGSGELLDLVDPTSGDAQRFYRARVDKMWDPEGMVWIERGTFTMGSPDDEAGRATDEGPQTQVTFTEGFWLGRYEVTQAEYQSVRSVNPSHWQGDNLPVEMVSWNDAVAYCQELTQQERDAGLLPEGYEYRVPTEAEWEYACRAGTTTRHSFGESDADFDEFGWFTDNSDAQTHPVGQKLPNSWGLYDMQGNVWEWCSDWWNDRLRGWNVANPRGPSTGGYRVYRGGSWHNSVESSRCARRAGSGPSLAQNSVGFRVALARTSVPTNPDPERFVWIPAGTFLMGSPDTESGRYADESPQTQVTISRGFWMGRYEVIQREYQAVRLQNPSYWRGDELPMESVTWFDAVGYCEQLTQQERDAGRLLEGWEYRLPTEAQWEYACRAGTTTRFSFGDALGCGNDNNCDPCAAMEEHMVWCGNGVGTTEIVGTHLANPWGLHDMHGSVNEWCADWYARLPGGSAIDPAGPTTGLDRVLRGGSWFEKARDCRAPKRSKISPSLPNFTCGFRVVLVEVP